MVKYCPKCCNVIRNVAVRCDMCGYVFVTPITGEVKRCGSCNGFGYADYPVCMSRCRVCRGTGYVRV